MKLFLSSVFAIILFSASSQDFNVYVSDAGNFNNPPWKILKFDSNGENPIIFTEDSLAWPQDIVFLENNTTIISNLNTGKITQYNSESGDYLGEFASGIGGPTRMEIGDDGYLYVLQWSGNGLVWRYDLEGNFVDEFSTVGITTSIGLDWDSEGNLYVSSYSGNYIRKFGTEGEDLGIFANTNLNGPTNIWFNDSGELLVLNWNAGTISQFDSDGNFIETFSEGYSQPEGIDFLDNGNYLIGDGGTASVKLVSNEGGIIEDFIEPELGGLIQPNAVVIHYPAINSISEEPLENVDKAILTSTVGSIFEISTIPYQEIDLIKIYSNTGGVIKTLRPDSNLVWNASGNPEGNYIIEINFKNGKAISEKVIVTH